MRNTLTFLMVLVSSLALGQSVPATQVGASTDTGLNPHTPYSLGVGNVNLTNGNLNLEIPLINLPGRAGNSYTISLEYDSKIWMPTYIISGDGSTIVYTWRADKRNPQVGELGWRLNQPWLTQGGWETDENGYQTGVFPGVVTLPDGSKHSIGENRFCCGQSLDSEDGSNLRLTTSGSDWIIRTKSGDAMYFPQTGGYTRWIYQDRRPQREHFSFRCARYTRKRFLDGYV